jgi:RHS repeat-associated protein
VERKFFYDYAGRNIQTVERNVTGGESRYSWKYDFQGRILIAHESHEVAGADGASTTDTKRTDFTYDTRGRVLSETTTLNDLAPAVVRYEYDEWGRLSAKLYGAGEDALREEYSYNLQGWLTSKRSALFEQELYYYAQTPYYQWRNDRRSRVSQTLSWSGNITAWSWRFPEQGGEENIYTFKYDDLGRLRGNSRFVKEPGDEYYVQSELFTERSISYDDNGNIKTLQRVVPDLWGGAGEYTHNYLFTKTGNRLMRLIDRNLQDEDENISIGTFTWDFNGNMTSDSGRGLEMEYNFLNLSGANRYSADGVLVESPAGLRLGSLEYTTTSGVKHLKFTGFGGGRIGPDVGGVVYSLTDHLGTIRVEFNDLHEVLARVNYYPFGDVWKDDNYTTTVSDHYFNGKPLNQWEYRELDYTAIESPSLDYGARIYETELARWRTPDPLAETYRNISPYAYCAGNPILLIDPYGLDIYVYDQNGNYKDRIPDEQDKVRIVDENNNPVTEDYIILGLEAIIRSPILADFPTDSLPGMVYLRYVAMKMR